MNETRDGLGRGADSALVLVVAFAARAATMLWAGARFPPAADGITIRRSRCASLTGWEPLGSGRTERSPLRRTTPSVIRPFSRAFIVSSDRHSWSEVGSTRPWERGRVRGASTGAARRTSRLGAGSGAHGRPSSWARVLHPSHHDRGDHGGSSHDRRLAYMSRERARSGARVAPPSPARTWCLGSPRSCGRSRCCSLPASGRLRRDRVLHGEHAACARSLRSRWHFWYAPRGPRATAYGWADALW